MHKPLLLTALLVVCAAPAQSDALLNAHPRTSTAAHTLYATAVPPARPVAGLGLYRCGNYAVFAGSTLATVRYWIQHGATPQQAAEMTSRGGADAFVAEMATQAPDAITPDDFRRQILVDCLKAAAERK
jgi:hypothetical protein